MHDGGSVVYTENDDGTFTAVYTASVTFQKRHDGQEFSCEVVFTGPGDSNTKSSPTIATYLFHVSCVL